MVPTFWATSRRPETELTPRGRCLALGGRLQGSSLQPPQPTAPRIRTACHFYLSIHYRGIEYRRQSYGITYGAFSDLTSSSLHTHVRYAFRRYYELSSLSGLSPPEHTKLHKRERLSGGRFVCDPWKVKTLSVCASICARTALHLRGESLLTQSQSLAAHILYCTRSIRRV